MTRPTHRRHSSLVTLLTRLDSHPLCVSPLLFVSVEKHDTKLKHASAPKESAALTQAKVLKAVEGKHELQHVETKGGSGLTEAQKEAFKNKVKDEE